MKGVLTRSHCVPTAGPAHSEDGEDPRGPAATASATWLPRALQPQGPWECSPGTPGGEHPQST